jgi:hypothetical protein
MNPKIPGKHSGCFEAETPELPEKQEKEQQGQDSRGPGGGIGRGSDESKFFPPENDKKEEIGQRPEYPGNESQNVLTASPQIDISICQAKSNERGHRQREKAQCEAA